MKTKVLIVDDSAFMRAVLSEIINTADDMEVIGTARDPLAARDAIKALNPDVLTLDIEMPRMDGLDFLTRLMKLRPMPVVMISSLTERGSDIALKALELGAVDFLPKPKIHPATGLIDCADEIRDKIRMAHKVQFGAHATSKQADKNNMHIHHAPQTVLNPRVLRENLVLIGASTGGTEAIKEVLTRLPAKMPGILIVQHMPEMFTGSFAKRLDSLCALQVKEAESGERIEAGTAYIAPGHSHLLVKKVGSDYFCELSRAEPVNRHRPSVDVLFDSAVKQKLTSHALAVILTGMGKDGAQGMLAMKKAGAYTIAQDQESCVVWGMPREAAQIGAACEIAPLTQIAERVLQRLHAPGCDSKRNPAP